MAPAMAPKPGGKKKGGGGGGPISQETFDAAVKENMEARSPFFSSFLFFPLFCGPVSLPGDLRRGGEGKHGGALGFFFIFFLFFFSTRIRAAEEGERL